MPQMDEPIWQCCNTCHGKHTHWVLGCVSNILNILNGSSGDSSGGSNGNENESGELNVYEKQNVS
jgi:hypothetical protein